MQARKQQEKPGHSQRDPGPARRSGSKVLAASAAMAPEAVTALQRTVGNAATTRMIADRRQAGPGIQRAADGQADTRPVKQQLDKYNVLNVCAAGAFDGPSVTPGRRAADLRTIVWENHWAAISAVCKKHKYTIAVRETGEYSIRRIAEGAKAKPHTILEKSIKPASVGKKYGNGPGQVHGDPVHILDWLEANDLSGFVGHWNDQGLAGVRIDNPPDTLAPGTVQQGAHGEKYVPLDMEQAGGGPAMVALKTDQNWKEYLYTGDYDLHEVYSAQGGTGGGQIPEATPEKAKLLNRLNDGIARNSQEQVVRSGSVALEDGRLHTQTGSDYAMFQHGDQATYRMNQYLESEVARHASQLVRAVATEADEPLAWCRMGQWYVTRTRAEHAVLRSHWKLATPHTWGADEVDRTAANGYRTAHYTA
ncbi:hypothetical protein [Streptomyces laculatispora]|uniref:hypothetical protein n=1 Tax=Streptomyces laculatispora TaxID=887464 RepID=UPI001A94FAEC|nr:hypothetical protein [Streptomyces laculatispora]MBO0918094.1 hypothetical protein [Streptomyces laculatispora]